MTTTFEATSGDVIATRTLRLVRPDGTSAPIEVLFFRPSPLDEGGDFRCAFRIRGFDEERTYHSFGVDAVQALLLAFQAAGAFLRQHVCADSTLRLEWLEGREDLGFPARIEYT